MISHEDIIKSIWPEWRIEKLIGRGAYGSVYKAVREEHGLVSYAAIKIIPIPQDLGEVEALRSEGMTDSEIRAYYDKVLDDFTNEIRMLISLKGAPNIVSIEDYKVVDHPEEYRWDILIRMELLTPFLTYTKGKTLSTEEVLRLGVELCSALEICHGQNVIHRDIKPQNIFVDKFGSYRLGDFGIARKMEGMTGGMSQKGTYGYIAPEVSHSLRYDKRADIYSVGLVLYQLMNEGRLPFLENAEEAKNPRYRTEALQRRLEGEELPNPCGVDEDFGRIILKACRYKPAERYNTISEMKRELQRLLYGYQKDKSVSITETGSIEAVEEDPDDERTISSSRRGYMDYAVGVSEIKKKKKKENRKKETDGSENGEINEIRKGDVINYITEADSGAPGIKRDRLIQWIKPVSISLVVTLLLVLGGGLGIALKLSEKSHEDTPQSGESVNDGIENDEWENEDELSAVVNSDNETVEETIETIDNHEEIAPSPVDVSEKKWYKIYRNYINQFILSWNPVNPRFCFIHIDDDDIPELVYASEYEEEGYENSLVDFIVYQIYNGKVEEIESFIEGPFEYIAYTGRFRFVHEFAAMGPTVYFYCDIKDMHGRVGTGSFGCAPRNIDGNGRVQIGGFDDYFGEISTDWRYVSIEEYNKMMQVCYPITAEAGLYGETVGANYTVDFADMVPLDELHIMK